MLIYVNITGGQTNRQTHQDYSSEPHNTNFISSFDIAILLFELLIGPSDISQDGDVGVSLYSKKVLILSKANQILPRWLRFMKGVVDSEDIPLNLSRELLQDSNLIRKLRTILTQRIIRQFGEEARADEAKFKQFYDDFNLYFKEGITKAQEQQEREDIGSVLRFESNRTEPGKLTTLDEYVKRMGEGQKDILYFAAPT